MDEVKKKDQERLGLIITANGKFNALLEQASRDQAQNLIEQFGVLHAIADGAFDDTRLYLRGAVLRPGHFESIASGQLTHLQVSFLQLLVSQDSDGIRRLARNMYLVECLANGMFLRDALMTSHSTGIEVSYFSKAEDVLSLIEVDGGRGRSLVELICDNTVERRRTGLYTLSLVSMASKCVDDADIASALAAVSMRPADMFQTIAFVKALRSDSDLWRKRELSIVAPGTFKREGDTGDVLVFEREERSSRLRPRVLCTRHDHVNRLFEGGIGKGRYVLAAHNDGKK